MAKSRTLLNPTEEVIHQFDWETIGNVTVQQAALAVNARDNASVMALAEANRILLTVEEGAVAYELRFRSDGNEDDENVWQVYAEAGEDHFVHLAQLTTVQGTQDHETGHFADEITEAVPNWITDTKVVDPAVPADTIARYVFNTHGYTRFAFVCSTLATTTGYIDARRF